MVLAAKLDGITEPEAQHAPGSLAETVRSGTQASVAGENPTSTRKPPSVSELPKVNVPL
jgi:hypothetical protein